MGKKARTKANKLNKQRRNNIKLKDKRIGKFLLYRKIFENDMVYIDELSKNKISKGDVILVTLAGQRDKLLLE